MPHNPEEPLPPIIEDIILENQICSLEGGLVSLERTRPSHPLLAEGRALLDGMKCEWERRMDACAIMLAAGPVDMDALIAGNQICRSLFRHWFAEFQWEPQHG